MWSREGPPSSRKFLFDDALPEGLGTQKTTLSISVDESGMTQPFDDEVDASAKAALQSVMESTERSVGNRQADLPVPYADHGATLADTLVSRKKRKKQRGRRPSDMPARPLSAYNFFFREERVRWLDERQKIQHDSGKEKHTRLFYAMGKELGKRWKDLNEAERATYHKMANEDASRYRSEMESYNKKVAERSGLHNAPTTPTALSTGSNVLLHREGSKSTPFWTGAMPLTHQYQGMEEKTASYVTAGFASAPSASGQAKIPLAAPSRNGSSVGLQLCRGRCLA